jgi:F0F1-type ATP synthase membrane subunit b/b'
MASLELKPEPIVVAVQGVIFLASMYSVKKLMLEPFLKLRERRKALTEGRFQEARKIVDEAEQKLSAIRERMREAAMAARSDRDVIVGKAVLARTELIAKAEAEGKQVISEMKNRISVDLAGERAVIKSQVSVLTKQVMDRVLG